MLVELLKDHTVGWQLRRERVVDEAERGAGNEIAAVRIGLRHSRAEVAIGDRKRAGHAAAERKVLFGEVTHRLRAGARHESLARPSVVRLVGHPPVVPHAVGLAFRRHVEGVDEIPLSVRVLGGRLPVRSEGEPVAPSDEPEDVVERVVLHHHHDEMIDLRHLVGARSSLGEGEGSRLSHCLVLVGGRGPGDVGKERLAGCSQQQGRAGQSTAEELASAQFHPVSSPSLRRFVTS